MVDYKKRTLMRLVKAYDLLHDAINLNKTGDLNQKEIMVLANQKEEIEQIIENNGYKIILNFQSNKFKLKKLIGCLK